MFRLRDDRGTVAILVALILVPVLVGMAAFVVDIGAVYSESRQLQNAADAAALTMAQDCAVATVTTCTNAIEMADAKAVALANGNSADAKSTINSVCGIGQGLGACTGTTARWDCPSTTMAKYVQVQTNTLTSGGTSFLPTTFYKLLPGAGSLSTEKACARVAWGPPAGLTTGLPLTAPECEVKPVDPATVRYIYLKGEDCASPPSGGKDWLATDNGSTCNTTTAVGAWADSDPGRSAPNNCDDYMSNFINTTIYIPIWTSTRGNGRNGEFLISGYAAFKLTGYSFNGGANNNMSRCPAGASTDCLMGYFVNGIPPGSGDIGTGPSYGAVVLKMDG